MMQGLVDEKLRLNACDLGACVERALCENPHEPDLRSAVDKVVAAFTDPCAQLTG